MNAKSEQHRLLGRSRDPELFEALGRLIRSARSPEFPELLREFLGREISFVNLLILAFSKDRSPVDLYHWIPEASLVHYQDLYFNQAYKLDPYYHAALRAEPPGSYTLKEVAPDRFFQSEYYRSYYQMARMIDELGILCNSDSGHTLHLSLGRKRGTGRFPRSEVRALRALQPTISALLQIFAQDRLSDLSSQPVHEPPPSIATDLRTLTHVDGIACKLTDREADVTSLILRGHSSNSIGLNLGISPETVKVHRKHIYAKLNVSSQAQLFVKLIPVLGATV